MNSFEVETLVADALAGFSAGAPIFAGAIAGDPEWPRVLVKVQSADMRTAAPWRVKHDVSIVVQGRFDSDNADIEEAESAAYAEHTAVTSALWARLEVQEDMKAATGTVDARLEGYRADIDAKQGLFISIFNLVVETN